MRSQKPSWAFSWPGNTTNPPALSVLMEGVDHEGTSASIPPSTSRLINFNYGQPAPSISRQLRPPVTTAQAATTPITPLRPPHDGLLSHVGGLPLTAMPREGKRTWGFDFVTERTVATTDTLLAEGRPGASGQLSLYRAYCKWREHRLQRQLSCGETLAIFGGYLVDAGLKASTCSTYVATALFFERRLSPRGDPQFYLAEDTIRALNRRACSEPREHAPDTSEERVRSIFDILRNQEVAFTVWAMCVCGGRAADLLRLIETGGFFRIVGNRVRVHFTLTKNRSEQCEQYSIDLPIWIPFRQQWKEYLDRPNPFCCNAQKINDTLHAAGFNETSYSFRRLFINHVIERLTENGITNWLAVIELTGHQQVKMVKGLYKSHK